jgi:hypothetical protein
MFNSFCIPFALPGTYQHDHPSVGQGDLEALARKSLKKGENPARPSRIIKATDPD